MTVIPFTKLEAAGNDFILVDLDELPDVGSDLNSFAVQMCDRRRGVGGDGLVTVHDSGGDVEIHTINADGSNASTCGNALRGVARFVASAHPNGRGEIHMSGRAHAFWSDGDNACVTMPSLSAVSGPVEIDGRDYFVVHTGTEHVVTIVDDVDALDVEDVGRKIRYAQEFSPLGTNVNFVQIIDAFSVKIRTWERGVERETLSCGSGAVAAALVVRAAGLSGDSSLILHNRYGSPLEVSVLSEAQDISSASVCGPIHIVFSGEYNLV